jgi:hypothetical protein
MIDGKLVGCREPARGWHVQYLTQGHHYNGWEVENDKMGSIPAYLSAWKDDTGMSDMYPSAKCPHAVVVVTLSDIDAFTGM